MDSDPPLPSPPRLNRKIRVTAQPSKNRTSFPTVSSTSSKTLDRFLGSSGTPSSDPPLFSSDDFQSSALENYGTTASEDAQDSLPEGPTGRKRRYRGTWWGQKLGNESQSRQSKRTKRTGFKSKRNVDSGVWLGSTDTTDDGDESAAVFTCGSDDSVFCEEMGVSTGRPASTTRGSVTRRLPVSGTAGRPTEGSSKSPVAKGSRSTESIAHAKARQIINTCLDDGDDRVDLS